MPDISKIDKNFIINNEFELDDVCFYSVKENPWCLFGLMYDDFFRRMPETVAKNVNEGVQTLHKNTSGGRIRFRTNSEYVSIRAVMPDKVVFSHMPNTGVSGFDMYVENRYTKTFGPPFDISDGYESVFDFEDSKEREIQLFAKHKFNEQLTLDYCYIYVFKAYLSILIVLAI